MSNSLWLPILPYFQEFAQTHAHWICDVTQPISSSTTPFSSCSQSFPVSGSFPESWLFASGGLSIGASASASVLWMNSHDWLPLGFPWIPWNSPGKNAGVDSHSLLQEIFPTQGSKPGISISKFFTIWSTREAPQLSLAHFKKILQNWIPKQSSWRHDVKK